MKNVYFCFLEKACCFKVLCGIHVYFCIPAPKSGFLQNQRLGLEKCLLLYTFDYLSHWAERGLVLNQRVDRHGGVTKVYKTGGKVDKRYTFSAQRAASRDPWGDPEDGGPLKRGTAAPGAERRCPAGRKQVILPTDTVAPPPAGTAHASAPYPAPGLRRLRHRRNHQRVAGDRDQTNRGGRPARTARRFRPPPISLVVGTGAGATLIVVLDPRWPLGVLGVIVVS